MTECKAAYLLAPDLKPIEPAFIIRIFEPGQTGLWTGDVINNAGKQLASASAPEFQAVWAMLEAVMRREVPDQEAVRE